MLENVSTNLWSWWWDASNRTQASLFTTVLALVITTLTVFWFCKSVKKPKQATATLPPGPRGLPILGYLPFLGNNLHKKFTELGKVHGPIFKLWLGNKLCVVVSSPSLAKEVVRDKDVIFSHRDPPIAALVSTYGGGDIAWSSYGPQWKKMRKIFVREMLSNANLDASYALRKEEIAKAVRDVYVESGRAINIGDLAFSISANSVIRLLSGGTIRGDKWTSFVAEIKNSISELMVLEGMPNVSDYFPILARFDFQGIEKQARKVFQTLDRILDSAIEEHLNLVIDYDGEEAENKVEKSEDFMQILLDLNKHEDTDTSITTNQLKAILLDIVIGGTDTTSTMIEWTMAELMKNQHVMEKVQQELEQVVGMNNLVEEFHLSELQYLEAVVKETIRLHPAVPLLVPRFSGQASSLGGYTIPKGTTVFLNVYAMHRDPHLWANPLEFKPERFQELNGSKFDYSGNNFQYLPFGSGRRVCAGIPLAEKMLMYVMATLLHSFDWKLPSGAELELSDKFGIVVKKLKPLIGIPTPRLSNCELY